MSDDRKVFGWTRRLSKKETRFLYFSFLSMISESPLFERAIFQRDRYCLVEMSPLLGGYLHRVCDARKMYTYALAAAQEVTSMAEKSDL